MKPISEHPAFQHERKPFAPMTDEYRLVVHLRHVRQLDPTAVYQIVGNSTVVYYDSPNGKKTPPGGSCRIVYAPDGHMRRIGMVGFDPRTAVEREKTNAGC